MQWHIIHTLTGIVLIVLGLVALFTPLTPGSWLIVVGAELLGVHLFSRAHKKQVDRHKKR